MARSSKKELGIELENLIDTVFAKFEMFLPSPQDVAVYRRKRKEYLDEITATLREGGISDGRAEFNADGDGDGTDAGN